HPDLHPFPTRRSSDLLENFRPLTSEPIRVAEETLGIPDFYISNASFLKLRELSLAYTLPDLWSKAIGASRTMVSLAGRNLHTWRSEEHTSELQSPDHL